MRILILSDLHITPDSDSNSTPWVNNFCNFMRNKYYPDTLILVLGDVINNDGKSGEMAFNAASKIFSYIESELSSVNYKIAFIPGNHDYCNGNLSAFEQFCRRHQTIPADPLLFSRETTFNFTVENFNSHRPNISPVISGYKQPSKSAQSIEITGFIEKSKPPEIIFFYTLLPLTA